MAEHQAGDAKKAPARGKAAPHEEPPHDDGAEDRKGADTHTPEADTYTPEPYAYIADEPLFVSDPEAGAMPARAYNPGDLVPPADLKRHPDWAARVHAPEE